MSHKLPFLCRECGVVFDCSSGAPTDCHNCRTKGSIVVREAWQRYQTMLAEQYERHLLLDRDREIIELQRALAPIWGGVMSFQAVMQAAKQARAEKRLDYELAQYKRRTELQEMAQEVDQYVEQFKFKSSGKVRYRKPSEPANKPEDFEGYIPLRKAAGIIKLCTTQLSKMCRQGNLKAKRMRKPHSRTIWYIREDYAHRCAERRRVGANFWWRD